MALVVLILRGTFCALAATALLSGCGGSSGNDENAQDDNPPDDIAIATKPSETIAFRWNELLLSSIRNDLARPTVHARNLFHISAAMYDAWAAGDSSASPYLLGQQRNGVNCAIGEPVTNTPVDVQRAISYAAYRLIIHRYSRAPGRSAIRQRADALMQSLNYDPTDTSVDVSSGGAALGNRIAECYIAYGLADGANETGNYANESYLPINPPLAPAQPGNPDIVDIDHWQSIALSRSVDQAGNPIIGVPAFVGAEWGRVLPFALTADDRETRLRDGVDYSVYLDPGPPPRVSDGRFDDYRWHFSLVSRWASHLDPSDAVMIDISPGAIGNIGGEYLSAPVEPRTFYRDNGGDPGNGRALNPVTGAPYAPQLVARGDYTRVLAEYWADGPESETPPGHWFLILNDIVDPLALNQPMSDDSPALPPLEWLVKAYFTLGGAMHDSAIAAWGLKGWYDYVRPISAIRAMADAGQSSDPVLPSYSVRGLALEPGAIELIGAGDPLAGTNGEHVNKIKLYTWRGPDLNESGTAGVGWMLAEQWWPYQRPTFVTPPFAGYVSGHSTYSSAAATVLERLSGETHFPGGLYEVPIDAENFLAFERGPAQALTLQWATYRDAADQCSLSRIWGGIHPPADDLPGRRIGVQVGERAFNAATRLFTGEQVQP